VVAVSGGSDSVGLLRFLHALAPELGLTLSVAHLDHGARKEASWADAEFVEALARYLDLAFDLGHWQPVREGHFEADARRARYHWLYETAVARGAAAVAVGHTRDDQAETILHRILRGTGFRGLAGIPHRRILGKNPAVSLVRPLLTVSRDEIRLILQELNQPYREDATNMDLARTRARIRHNLLPRLKRQYNPRVVEALARLGILAAETEQVLETRLVELERDLILSADGELVTLRRDQLVQLPRFLRAEFLRGVWRKAGWPEAGMTAKRWRRLAALVQCRQIHRVRVGAGIELTTRDGSGSGFSEFLLRRTSSSGATFHPPKVPDERIPTVPGCVTWGSGMLRVLLDADAQRDETIDLDKIVLPLRIRSPVPGDRFEPLGMGGMTTPLNDFFRGRKVALIERTTTPLLCDELGIVWVVGHRIADRVKVSEHTSRTLGLRWESQRGSSAGDIRSFGASS
jgi:tRNA(Ile)-lysidine synthase